MLILLTVKKIMEFVFRIMDQNIGQYVLYRLTSWPYQPRPHRNIEIIAILMCIDLYRPIHWRIGWYTLIRIGRTLTVQKLSLNLDFRVSSPFLHLAKLLQSLLHIPDLAKSPKKHQISPAWSRYIKFSLSYFQGSNSKYEKFWFSSFYYYYYY